jgi:hypothetical protein
MLLLTQGNAQDSIVVTLTEKSTLESPVYLFVFEHITTKQIVNFIATNDISGYPDRYNEFYIPTAELFTELGQYVYNVYEQMSRTNTDPTGLNNVENGQAKLQAGATSPVFSEYTPPTTYKTYGG